LKLYMRKEGCCGCGACADVCPKDAVRMARDREGFLYPKVSRLRCVSCGRCQQVCPLPRPEPEALEHLYFGARAKEEGLRLGSSSGGMFPVLARHVFAQGGVVYGAAYDEHMAVAHREARNEEELEGLKRTKYVQSRLDGVYRRVEARLKEGRQVLFCGMPCQVQALRRFLGRPYPALLAVDLVCYGVPSPGVWERYVRHLQKVHGGHLTGFSFRDKRNRDSGHTRAYTIDGTEYAGPLNSDPYCQLMFRNYTLRPACHACPYCAPERDSDITIGDFWGVEKVRPEMDDGMGISLVILHTARGRAAWEAVRDRLEYFQCRREETLQPRLTGPTPASEGRAVFMKYYRRLSFPRLLQEIDGEKFLEEVQKSQREDPHG